MTAPIQRLSFVLLATVAFLAPSASFAEDAVVETAVVAPVEVVDVAPGAAVIETGPAEEIVDVIVPVDGKVAATKKIVAVTPDTLPGLNIEGIVTNIIVGKDHVELSLLKGNVDAYQNEPDHKAVSMTLDQAVRYAGKRGFNKFVLDIADPRTGNAAFFETGAVTKISPTTLRIALKGAHLQHGLKELEAAIKASQHTSKDVLTFRLANFAGRGANKTDFLISAKGGVEATQGANPGTWNFTFHNIASSLLHSNGGLVPVTPEKLIELLNAKPGFKPNGSVLAFDAAGHPTRITMEFSGFTFDKASGAFHATATPLPDALSGDLRIAPAIMNAKSFKCTDSVVLFLDPHMITGTGTL